ncbi:hypothetical protein PQR72_27810 [Paraburkholderia madseniana]|uniref:YncE family protein n=2 Tax=Paraburkholderia madseniana TaxID=2599607 RepID=UPI0038BB6904
MQYARLHTVAGLSARAIGGEIVCRQARKQMWPGSEASLAASCIAMFYFHKLPEHLETKMKLRRVLGITVLSASLLTACGGGDNLSSSGVPHVVADIAIPGVGPGVNFSFDLGDISGGRFFFTDRNNAAVDVIDIASQKLVAQIKGSGTLAFAGAGARPALSGPDGINAVGNLLYVGDVNSLKIADPATNTIVKNITVSTGGVRADEGCLDPVHGMYMISSPEEATPFATFIDTQTQTILAKVTFSDAGGAPSAGLEQCRYDAASDTFFVNNDGSTANPHGELIKVPAASIRAIPHGATVNYTALAGAAAYPLGNCDPTGLALGPGTDAAVGCREGTAGAPLLVQILNRSSGALVASLNAGGGDEIQYDTKSNRYYNASYRWTATGNSVGPAGCSAAAPCTPVLTIIDAATRAVVARVATGNNTHSVAVDPVSGLIFMPYSAADTPAGCATCAANRFTNGGVLAFQM